MEKGGEQLPLSVSTILGGTIKKIKKEVNSSSSFKVHVPPIIDYSQYSMEKGGEQLPLSVSTILGGTIKKIKKEVNSSSSFKVHVPPST